MNSYHGIIDAARSYMAGNRSSFSDAQERRTVQEIFRALAGQVEGVDAEVLLNAIKDGLNEHGLTHFELATVLRFFDALRVPTAGGVFKVGDRVRCPSQYALGTNHSDDILAGEVGTVISNDYGEGDPDVHVQWGRVSLYHRASELVRVSNDVPATVRAQAIALMRSGQKIQAIKSVREATAMGLKEAKDYVEALPLNAPAQVVSLADAGLVPSIINTAINRGYTLTTAQDRELVAALLDSLPSRERGIRGIFVAQSIKPQAKVLAASREIECVEVDYDELRGIESDVLRLF